jgi:hypothetical protein
VRYCTPILAGKDDFEQFSGHDLIDPVVRWVKDSWLATPLLQPKLFFKTKQENRILPG